MNNMTKDIESLLRFFDRDPFMCQMVINQASSQCQQLLQDEEAEAPCDTIKHALRGARRVVAHLEELDRMMDQLMSVSDASEQLGVPTSVVIALAGVGVLPSIRPTPERILVRTEGVNWSAIVDALNRLAPRDKLKAVDMSERTA